ncbi:MAG: hypothetical protein HUU10_14305 [Bacteroidetes bacterium]|nr:hypothetical protein [Bacteroidota bacterium]
MPRFLLTVLTLFLSAALYGQSALLYRYGLDEGLPSSYVKYLLQLPSGEMLIATDNGLAEFNGYNFTNYHLKDGLPSIYVKYLLLDSKEQLWVGTNTGLATADPANLRAGFTKFPLDKETPDMRILNLIEDSKGRIWAASDGVIYVISGEMVTKLTFPSGTYFASDFVRSFDFAEDSRGGMWVTSLGSGIWYVSADLKNPVPVPIPGMDPLTRIIYPVGDNKYLVGTSENTRNPGSTGLFEVTINPEQPQQSTARMVNQQLRMVNRLTPMGDGSYHVATDGYGYLVWDSKTNTTRKPFDIKSPYLKDVKVDRQRNTWILCDDGVYLNPFTIFRNVTEENGLPNRYVSKIVVDSRNRAFISNYEGVFVLEDGSKRVRRLAGGVSGLFTKSMILDEPENTLYVFGEYQVFLVNLTTLATEKQIRLPNTGGIEHAFMDSKKRIWLPALTQLVMFNTVSGAIQLYDQKNGVESNLYSAIEDKDGNIYIGGSNRMMYQADPAAQKLKPLDWSSYATAPDSLALFDYLSRDDQNRIWIGASSGLYIWTPGKTLEQVVTDQLTPMDNVRFSVHDGTRTWVGTNRYLFLLTLNATGEVVGKRVFRKRNGLESTSFSIRSATRDNKGRLWMGTNVGVSYTTGEAVSEFRPTVRMASWRTNLASFFSTNFQSLDPSTSTIQFDYYAIDYPADDIYYQTRIVGLNDQWSDPGTSRSYSFSVNKAGSYELQVRASKEIGAWGEPMVLSFNVEPHWYVTWWMIVIYILGTATLVLSFIRIRSRALQQRNAELEASIKERTADIIKKDAELTQLLHEMDAKGKQIYEESLQVNENISSMTAGTVQQSSSIAETTATMEELAQSNKFIEESAMKVSNLAIKTQQVLDKVNFQTRQTITQMDKVQSATTEQMHLIKGLAERMENIRKVSQFIESVNDQTQLIAFNAAIEATMAGDMGRRFGVIADEIRNLSHEINQSTREIKQNINEMMEDMETVVKSSKDTHKFVMDTVGISKEMSGSVGELTQSQQEVTTAATGISKSTAQQTIANSQMVTSLREIAETSNHMVDSIHSISKASGSLENIARFFMEVKRSD